MSERAAVVPVDEQGGTGLTLIPLAEHKRAVSCGIDVPEQEPEVTLPLDEVGISGKTVWLRLGEAMVPMTAAISVDLPARRRGIHMSRMEEAVSDLHEKEFPSPLVYGRALAAMILASQEGSVCRVELSGDLPLVRRTRVSERSSLDTLRVDCRVTAAKKKGGKPEISSSWLGVAAHHITACPCTQAYNRELSDDDRIMPMPTHSQRSRTRLALKLGREDLEVEDLLACLDQALHLTSDLLKRPDEAEIVMQSHRRPQFAEDAVREVARAVWHRYGADLHPETGVEIESVSLESIHIHDVRCRLCNTLAGIGKYFG